MDARQGYHQVFVIQMNREKLALFGPDYLKYYFNVILFSPTNSSSFYMTMMKDFKNMWDTLFIFKLKVSELLDGAKLLVTGVQKVFLNEIKVVSDSCNIIDDILLWCSNKELILICFECVYEKFRKYRVNFRLDKCKFLKSRVEYIGHDILPTGFCSEKSKFDMINDWTLTSSGKSI